MGGQSLPPWDRTLVVAAGLHTVKDLYCNSCNALLGWRYCSAKEKAQRYKEGRLLCFHLLTVWRHEIKPAYGLAGKYVLEMSKLLELDRDDLNGD